MKTRDKWSSFSTSRRIDPKKLEGEIRTKLKKTDASKIDIDIG